ncbi:hypothetical protein [Halovivax asiaticus]|uniref:hypothetical protein n=1 Tax=Halovivax asiaticus TaxID=332953 RepID=UPI0012673515|nr:hypothetical protein [Halovivax asiaticus]
MLVYGYDLETTRFSPFEDQIISAQYSYDDGNVSFYPSWEYESERELLVDFLDDWAGIKRKRIGADGALFVGFNILGFDAPFLFLKCITTDGVLNDLGWSYEDCWNQIYRWPSYLDLAHLLGADFIGMEAVRGEIVGTQGDFAGEDVPEYYENGKHEIIEEYVRDELAAMAAIYEELRDSAFFEELMGIRRQVGLERELV